MVEEGGILLHRSVQEALDASLADETLDGRAPALRSAGCQVPARTPGRVRLGGQSAVGPDCDTTHGAGSSSSEFRAAEQPT